MKKIYITILSAFITFALQAQMDTLLFEDFQEDPTADWEIFPSGNDEVWVRYDEDGQPVNGGAIEEQNWYWAETFHTTADPDPHYGLESFSFMQDVNVTNRNWVILPPLAIYDNQAVLHWESAPYQLPRYMDGYKVLVSTTTNELESFTDTIFVAAEMTGFTGDGQTVVLDSFIFSEGYFHSNMMTDTNYFEYFSDTTLAGGLMEPHSFSLADYAGKTIYIAFLHDSHDDYYFQLDNILVTGSLTSGAKEARLEDFAFVTYPNPVWQQMNVRYSLPAASQVSLQVLDLQGKTIRNLANGELQSAGQHQTEVLLGDLPAGNYLLTLNVNGSQTVKPFIKK